MNFNYQNYFMTIKPKTKMDIYNRFIFAICSIHTTWQSNIKGYLLLKDKYHKTRGEVMTLVKRAGLGLNKNRTESIIQFTEAFREDYKFFLKRDAESWQGYAERLEKNIYGLGFAKTRFAIELVYPDEAEVCVVDTHIAQWAKQNPNKLTRKLYKSIETGWLNHAKQKGLHPIEARWKYWDNKQGFQDSRYWSWVLE